MKSRYLILSLMVVLTMLIAACGAEPTAPPAPTTAPEPTKAPEAAEPTEAPAAKHECDGVTLNYLSHPGEIIPHVDDVIPLVKEKYGITLKLTEAASPVSYQDALKDWRAGGGTYDLVMHFPRWNGELGIGYLRPLEDLIEKYDAQWIFDNTVDAYRELYTKWGGNTITIPIDGDVAMMYYRKDAFENPEYQAKFKEEYGYDLEVPKTWDQAFDIAEFFTGWEWGDTGQEGYGMQVSTWDRAFAEVAWGPMMASYGGNWFDDEMNPAINRDGSGAKALEDTRRILEYAPPDSISLSWGQTMDTVFAYDVAMVFWYMDLGRLGMSDKSWFFREGSLGRYDQLGFAQWPGYETESGDIRHFNSMFYGRVTGISNFSEHPECAFLVLMEIADKENHLRAADDPGSGIDMIYKHEYDAGLYEVLSPSQEYLDVAKEVVAYGFPEMMLPGAGEYMDVLQGEIQAYLTGQNDDAEAAMNTVIERWNDITTRWGREQQAEYWKAVQQQYQNAGLTMGQ